LNDTDKISLSYRDAGVDIDAGESLVEAIKPIARKTFRPEVLTGLGGFGALYKLPVERYKEPVLVSGTDGVGTKLKLATELNRHDTIGIDLVAMCANDIIVQGAEPLFFLDYLATGKLKPEQGTVIISGIAEGCRQAGAALIGGETAEMPGMYANEDYDLAGFCVGVVERKDIIDGSRVTVNDTLIGLASSGPHSNGYSLIRKVLEVSGASLDTPLDEQTLGDLLLAPTRIYVKPILQLLEALPIHAIAHITGGGLPDNLPRVLPKNTRAVIDARSWKQPVIFDWLQENGKIEPLEMYHTFNCGVGMVLALAAADTEKALELLKAAGENAFIIGHVETLPEDGLENRVEIIL